MKKDSDGTRCWQDGLRQASPICAHFKTAGVESSLSLFCMRPLSPACMDLLPSQGRSVSSRQDFYLCFCVPICPSPAALNQQWRGSLTKRRLGLATYRQARLFCYWPRCGLSRTTRTRCTAGAYVPTCSQPSSTTAPCKRLCRRVAPPPDESPWIHSAVVSTHPSIPSVLAHAHRDAGTDTDIEHRLHAYIWHSRHASTRWLRT